LVSTNNLHGAAAAPASLDRPAAEMARWSAAVAVGLLGGAAVLVAWRRLAGALVTPLEPPLLLSIAALLSVSATGVRLVWRDLPAAQTPNRLVGPLGLLPSAALLVLGASLSLPGTDARGLVAFWSLLVAEECWAWRPIVWRKWRGASRTSATARLVRRDPPQVPSPHTIPADPAAEVPPAEVVQQLTRSRAADGTDQLAGWLRARFSAGQRTGSVHVAFCPPFAKTPELSVAQLDGPEARIKAAQLLPYGARLDLKLGAAAEQPTSVLLHFCARWCGDEDH
jgi:hypothetical protein